MALAIYKKVDESYVEITEDTTSTIYTVHDGKNGTTSILQLFLRNDGSSQWYENISILPHDTENTNPYGDVAYYETGWGIKLIAGSNQPTTAEWSDVNWGESIVMEDIGSDSSADTSTYFPFWYLISSPPHLDAINKTDIYLKVNFTENAVI